MKRVAVVWGGYEGHEPKAAVDRFVPSLKEAGLAVELFDSLDLYRDLGAMRGYALILQCWTMGEIIPDQEIALATAVREGVGLAGWHGGLTDSFRAAPLYQFVVGGQFVTHSPGPVRYRVHIERPSDGPPDPVVAGIEDFDMESEQYYHHVDANNQVLATTSFVGFDEGLCAGAAVPFVWKRTFGAGRIFYAGFGHVATDFDVPQAFEITRRGILWAAGHEVAREAGNATGHDQAGRRGAES